MKERVENQNIIELSYLAPPRNIKTQLPLTQDIETLVLSARQEIRDILHGRDKHRLLVITGPCSIHDPEAAFEFAQQLKQVADSVRDHLLIVMRTYFEKPRTTVGWKGFD